MNNTPLNPLLKLLAFMVVFFAILLVGMSKWSPNDGQTFTALSTSLSTLIGLFGGLVMPDMKQKFFPSQTPPGPPPAVPVPPPMPAPAVPPENKV